MTHAVLEETQQGAQAIKQSSNHRNEGDGDGSEAQRAQVGEVLGWNEALGKARKRAAIGGAARDAEGGASQSIWKALAVTRGWNLCVKEDELSHLAGSLNWMQ